MSWELEVDIVNKTLKKKNVYFWEGKKYEINTNFKIINLKRNHLVAVTDEFGNIYIHSLRLTKIELSYSSPIPTIGWTVSLDRVRAPSAVYGRK